jgi:ABC-type microcin C transport system permease subunit YejB
MRMLYASPLFEGMGKMLVKVICLNFESAYGGFNDESVRDFIKDKEIISISDYLVIT